MKIDYKIGFFLEKRKDSTGAIKPEALIKLRVKYTMGIIDFSTGYKASVDKWVFEAQRCKAGTSHGKEKITASEINTEIGRLDELARDVFKAFEVNEQMPTLDQYKQSFNLANGKQVAPEAVEVSKMTLINYFDLFCNESGKRNDWTDATYEKFRAVRNHLIGFKADLSFDDLTENGLLNYIQYLRTTKAMRNSTISKQMGFLKWFLRWTTDKGYCTNNAYLAFKPKLKTSDKVVIYLNKKELMHLYNFEIPENKQYLARVRDVFCFTCFTSLRYSDAFNLKRSNIVNNSIEITTIKTADKISIPLNDYSKAILDKYSNIQFANDKALPVISNQKMNDYLKELGELVGFDTPIDITYYVGSKRVNETHPKYELLGTHAGRRTFICNALAFGIPADVVMKYTGHSDYKAMKPYIEIADNVKVEMMNKFNQM